MSSSQASIEATAAVSNSHSLLAFLFKGNVQRLPLLNRPTVNGTSLQYLINYYL